MIFKNTLTDSRVALGDRLKQISRDIDVIDTNIAALRERRRELEAEQALIQLSLQKKDVHVVNDEPDFRSDTSFPWNAELSRVLLSVFKFSTLRMSQSEVINALMSKRNVFVVMKTGGGKSLCYQLPAMVSGGLTIVVSPLLSLIRDQVKAMNAFAPGSAASLA